MTKVIKMVVVNEPTEKGKIVQKALFNAMKDANVKPEEVLPVLGEATINLIISFASVVGMNQKAALRDFGMGIANADFEIEK